MQGWTDSETDALMAPPKILSCPLGLGTVQTLRGVATVHIVRTKLVNFGAKIRTVLYERFLLKILYTPYGSVVVLPARTIFGVQ